MDKTRAEIKQRIEKTLGVLNRISSTIDEIQNPITAVKNHTTSLTIATQRVKSVQTEISKLQKALRNLSRLKGIKTLATKIPVLGPVLNFLLKTAPVVVGKAANVVRSSEKLANKVDKMATRVRNKAVKLTREKGILHSAKDRVENLRIQIDHFKTILESVENLPPAAQKLVLRQLEVFTASFDRVCRQSKTIAELQKQILAEKNRLQPIMRKVGNLSLQVDSIVDDIRWNANLVKEFTEEVKGKLDLPGWIQAIMDLVDATVGWAVKKLMTLTNADKWIEGKLSSIKKRVAEQVAPLQNNIQFSLQKMDLIDKKMDSASSTLESMIRRTNVLIAMSQNLKLAILPWSKKMPRPKQNQKNGLSKLTAQEQLQIRSELGKIARQAGIKLTYKVTYALSGSFNEATMKVLSPSEVQLVLPDDGARVIWLEEIKHFQQFIDTKNDFKKRNIEFTMKDWEELSRQYSLSNLSYEKDAKLDVIMQCWQKEQLTGEDVQYMVSSLKEYYDTYFKEALKRGISRRPGLPNLPPALQRYWK